ncbi:hypothetical protein HK405_006281, partial [Cladochytrium tenue]
AGNVLDSEFRVMAQVYARAAEVVVLTDGIGGVLSSESTPNVLWFTRAWTLQELVLAKSLRVAMGRDLVRWNTWLFRLAPTGLLTMQAENALELRRQVQAHKQEERVVLRASLSRAATRPVDRVIAAYAMLKDDCKTKKLLDEYINGEERIQSKSLNQLLQDIVKVCPYVASEIVYSTGQPTEKADQSSWIRTGTFEALSLGGLSSGLRALTVNDDGSLTLERPVISKVTKFQALPYSWMLPNPKLPGHILLPSRWLVLCSILVLLVIDTYHILDAFIGFTRAEHKSYMPKGLLPKDYILFNIFSTMKWNLDIISYGYVGATVLAAVGRHALILDNITIFLLALTTALTLIVYIVNKGIGLWIQNGGITALGYQIPSGTDVYSPSYATLTFNVISYVLYISYASLVFVYCALAFRARRHAKDGNIPVVCVIYTGNEEWLLLSGEPVFDVAIETGSHKDLVVVSAREETHLFSTTPGLLCVYDKDSDVYRAIGVCCASGVITAGASKASARIGTFQMDDLVGKWKKNA